MSTTEDRIAAIRARLAAATPGPWVKVQHGNTGNRAGDSWWTVNRGFDDGRLVQAGSGQIARMVSIAKGGGDAALVAHAPDDIAWLLAEVERLQAHADEGWDLAARRLVSCTAANRARDEAETERDELRAELVLAEVERDKLRAVVDALPKCAFCMKIASKGGPLFYCDTHAPPGAWDRDYAAALRALEEK
jgi:hypothetical protein